MMLNTQNVFVQFFVLRDVYFVSVIGYVVSWFAFIKEKFDKL